MGLLDRWTKKKQKEQLEENKAEKVEAKASKEAKAETTTEAPGKKKTTRAKKDTKKEGKVEKTEAAPVKAKISAVADKVLIAPLVTEKAAVMASNNKYGFIVNRNATKTQVKKAISEVYGVDAVAVNMINVQGKAVRFGRHQGRRQDYKKALVTLPQGKTINLHEGV